MTSTAVLVKAGVGTWRAVKRCYDRSGWIADCDAPALDGPTQVRISDERCRVILANASEDWLRVRRVTTWTAVVAR